jgi:hypothetical protein
MSIENQDNSLNYVLVGEPHDKGSSLDTHPITVTHGASTDQAISDKAERQGGAIRMEQASDAFDALEHMLRGKEMYTETYRMLPGGTFDKTFRFDDSVPPYLISLADAEIHTPEDLYQVAASVQSGHPEYQFDFEKDPEGQWMKYTVTKK